MAQLARSLYRRHRPRTFADVVGQEHVVRTLVNAVKQQKVHHAYLFVGSRGTGKTSMAKILAASLTCQEGPTATPCCACESCETIAGGTCLDVIEMDAASSNSVDDIRELRDKVAFAPIGGKYKVYILDEVHMLTNQAWNAFLKTLEEPPQNTIFVLATTEAQKVLPTVVDRCHRFDFQRPTVGQIATVVKRVSHSEGIGLDDNIAALIARSAAGSFRDALGILQQLATYSSALQLEDVLAVLGIADSQVLFKVIDSVLAGDLTSILEVVTQLANSGRDLATFLVDLEAHTRALMVVHTLKEVPSELALTDDYNQRLLAQSQRISIAQTITILDLLASGMQAVKAGSEIRIQLELALIKAACPQFNPDTQVKTVIASSAKQVVENPVLVNKTEANTALIAPKVTDKDEEKRLNQAEDYLNLSELWEKVIKLIQNENAMLAAMIKDTSPVEVTDNKLTVAFPVTAEFLKRKAEDVTYLDIVQNVVTKVLKRKLQVEYQLRDLDGYDAKQVAPTVDEWIKRFIQEFDAEEVIVEIDKGVT